MIVYAGLFVTRILLTRNERFVFEFEASDCNCLKYQQKIPMVVLVLQIELWWSHLQAYEELEYGLILKRAVYFLRRGANGPLPTVVGTYVDKNNKVWVGGKKTETETSTETVRR